MTSPIPDTPATLLDELARQGELDEFQWQRFDKLYRPVIGFFIRLRFASLAQDEEDLAQDVMARLVPILRQRLYRPGRARFRTFLAAIVHNLCVDRLRADARRRELSVEPFDLEALAPADSSGNPAEEMLDRQWAQACLDAARRHVLDHCPIAPAHREIYLALERGESTAALAARHGITPDAIRQIRHRIDRQIIAFARDRADIPAPSAPRP